MEGGEDLTAENSKDAKSDRNISRKETQRLQRSNEFSELGVLGALARGKSWWIH
jgi:hypothetical protein